MTDPLLGKLIAQRYRLVQRLAEGSSSVVYGAEHGTPPQRVAVKLVDPRWLQDPRSGEEVELALASASGIESAHMAKVLEVGREPGGALFLVMEHLDGETLATRLQREGRLPVAQVLTLLAQLGDALSEAHALGLVHGHLQPRKIFLTRRGGEDVVKLLGLGLARLAAVGDPPSGGVPALLDPHYLCPEQTRGAAIDPRSDIYSLAAVTYAMLCGAPPFAGSSPVALLTQHLEATPSALDQRLPELPSAMAAAVARGLHKAPDQRFPTVVRFLQALREPEHPAEARAQPSAALRPTRSQAVALAAPLGGGSTAAAEAPEEPAEALGGHERTLIGTGITSAEVQRVMAAHVAAAAARAPAQAPTEPAVIVKGADVALLTPEVFAAKTMLPGAVAPAPPREAVVGPAAQGEADEGEPDTRLGAAETTGVSLSEEAREWFAEGMAAEEALRRAKGEPATLPSLYGALGGDELPRSGPSPAVVLGAVLGLAVVVLGAVFWLSRDSGRSPLAELGKKRVTPGQEPLRLTAPRSGADTVAAGRAHDEPPAAAPAAVPTARAEDTVAAARPASAEPDRAAAPPTAQPAPAPAPTPTPSPAAAVARRQEPELPAGGSAPVPVDAPPTPTVRAPARSRRTRDTNQRVAEAQVELGQQRLRRGGYNEARGYFNAAVQLDARNAEAHGGLGEVAFELGNYVTAAQHLRRAAQLSPGQARYLVMLGDAYFKQGRTNDAVAQYRRALALAPNTAAARSGLEAAVRRLAREGN